MMYKKILGMLLFTTSLLQGLDTIVEFKGEGFFPTNSTFKDIYGKSGAFGLEATFDAHCKNFYGFLSLDFVHKKGTSIGLCDTTKLLLIQLGIGLKYLVPFCLGDFYIGLGFQPMSVRAKNNSPFVYSNNVWGLGGIAKAGSFFNLPHNFVLDLFVDYSFAKASPHCKPSSTCYVQPRKANLNAVIVGAGLGYRFG